MTSDQPINFDAVLATIQLAQKLTTKKKRTSVYPYYTEEAAATVIDTITEILTTGRPVVWSSTNLSLNTLYLRFRNGAMYAKEHLDPNFDEKLNLVKATKVPRLGLKISPREGVTLAVVDNSWRKELTLFIDEALPNNVFERIGIPFSEEDVSFVHESLAGVKELFIYDINKDTKHLTVVRT